MVHEKDFGQSYQRRTKARFDPQAQSDVPSQPPALEGSGSESGSGGGHCRIRKVTRKVRASHSSNIRIDETVQTVNVPRGSALPPRGGREIAGRGKRKAVASGLGAQDNEIEEDVKQQQERTVFPPLKLYRPYRAFLHSTSEEEVSEPEVFEKPWDWYDQAQATAVSTRTSHAQVRDDEEETEEEEEDLGGAEESSHDDDSDNGDGDEDYEEDNE
ncbi:histone H2A.Z-specific chaperone CHZ1-like [Phragmites australis]|uniref:histone H2A.Z-specific chaperone CHZ1-like n=1 Tax=Phragmites australis TaxID=29695 RepID=UPI002D764ABA|nr:histone H2A.Z-specific chaperone CHZ1-like [Phragmites australis]